MNFNAEAANWDNEKRIKRARIIANEIIKSITIQENSNALEFGCGTGLVSFNLINEFKHITLIDTSKGMIDTLKSKIEEYKITNMTALHGDINTNAEVRNQKYDVIYTSMALHHVKDIKVALKNLYDMLADNGFLCIVDLTEDDGSFHKEEKDFDGHNGFNEEQLGKILEELGFRNVSSNVFYNDVKVIGDSEVSYSLFLMSGEK